MAVPATLFDKIWSSHAILVRLDGATLLHIDRHLVHDGSGNAFGMLKDTSGLVPQVTMGAISATTEVELIDGNNNHKVPPLRGRWTMTIYHPHGW
jgi:homoaconitase/3-isopropylmalate dehydratase large subunit